MSDTIIAQLCSELKLTTVLKNYTILANEASMSNKSYTDYLKVLLQEELDHRIDNRIKKLIRQAKFPALKTLAEFQFNETPNLNKQKILELAKCHFIDQKSNICFLGQTGNGKSHLAIALGYEACKRKYPVLFFSAPKLVNELIEHQKSGSLTKFQNKLARVKLIILDELGYIPFSRQGAEHLFQFFADSYEQRSVIVTSNLEFSDWTKFMHDTTMASALLDRFTHFCDIFSLIGESYRFKHRNKLIT